MPDDSLTPDPLPAPSATYVPMPRHVLGALAQDDPEKQEMLRAWDHENELRRDAEERLAADALRHRAELDGIKAELRKHLSPGNANTDIIPMIRDLAQAKVSEQGNAQVAEAALTEARQQIARYESAIRSHRDARGDDR